MADVWKIFLLIVGTMLVFISYWVVAEALFPALVVRTRLQYQRPLLLTLVGLLLSVPFVAGGIYLLNRPNPVTKIVGGLIVALPIVLGLVGSSGLCQRVGIGLPAPSDTAQPWRRVLRGGIVLTITFLLPFVGWFFILPWTLVSGFAAALLAMRTEKKSAESAPAGIPAGAKEAVG